MVYENLLKKSTGKQTMNERGLKHVSLPEVIPAWTIVSHVLVFSYSHAVHLSARRLLCVEGAKVCSKTSNSGTLGIIYVWNYFSFVGGNTPYIIRTYLLQFSFFISRDQILWLLIIPT